MSRVETSGGLSVNRADAEADVMLRVETSGGLSVNRADAEALLKAPLRSHRTKGDFKNMPLLKAHLASCSEPVSTGVVY
ncbi:hypothetical protein T484DRAFT_1774724 [Baffinella frigidus]|nr:hypothetical protein T484DRAFT_1774724 [Cryptophyta sp. CCMP2293]